MKLIILVGVLVVLVSGDTQYRAPSPPRYDQSHEVIPIVSDQRVQEEDGRYNYDVETGNGIVLSQSGSPTGPEGAVVKSGQYSYTAPDGTPVVVKFVANEYGYQPESNLLPIAPEFPHPIPDFVLQQIAKAELEDRDRSREVPSGTYSAP
ncbi:hypothetical protein Pmani_003014 [Petrolisthes manimaculis]|uniref:Uncharacterized protein n=1 Tax=Petrolisthes manimaculis TaxID=1843537 RepID=A0AAE1QJE1_9EUCA|nr:hypothetical protein Pmani_003014 [Petrolisthes manimaculis]